MWRHHAAAAAAMGLGSPHGSGQLGYGPLAQYTVRCGCIILRVWVLQGGPSFATSLAASQMVCLLSLLQSAPACVTR